MRRIYPIRDGDFSNNSNIELYKCGIFYYEKLLRKNEN